MTRDSRNVVRVVMTIVAFVMVAGCATQTPAQAPNSEPGFFLGLFHGFTMLFAFIGSFFTAYEIYAFPNTGWSYNFGFLLGVMSFFGGSGSAAR